jgi:hypothetical protein
MLGFAMGHALVVIILYIFSFKVYPPSIVLGQGSFIWKTLKKFWPWWQQEACFRLDNGWTKLCTGFCRTRTRAGIRLYPEYDTAVYLANLSLIPGLVFFVIVSETRFLFRS